MSARRPPPAAAAWPGRRSIALAVGGLVVTATVWWLAAREPLQPAVARIAPGPTAPIAAPAPPRAPAALPPPPVTADPPGGTPGLSTDDPVTAYRKANVYPPTSRPLTADQLDLLRPGQRHETMRPDDHDAGITYLFTADRYFVIGDETLTATLDVRRDGKPIPVTITQAYATVIDPGGHPPPPIPLAFARSGALLAAPLAPARLDLPRQTGFGVHVEFDHGAGRQAAHFDFQYTPARGIPARFTGAFRDTVEAGSLVIHAGVAVETPGHYVIDCNLFDAADQPVAWSRFKGELAAGAHEADLLYFGKVILDGHARGPFHIGQLRGARFAPGLDPDLEQMPPFSGSYTTAPYPPEAFSDAEYDSPDKQRMLDLLGQDHNHGGAAGRSSGN
ncbi:MAG TPA: hypothetical protein VHW23_10800 [Kofleriaceae bacterium]|nr:hypothetical protein [Kofleriaceae bacterium]